MLLFDDEMSALSSSEAFSGDAFDDDVSEVDNDHFFLMSPYEEMSQDQRCNETKVTSEYGGFEPSDFVALHRSKSNGQENPCIIPLPPASPTSVAIHKLLEQSDVVPCLTMDAFHSAPPPPCVSLPKFRSENSVFEDDDDSDDDDCTPFIGLESDLNELSLYSDDDSDESYTSSKYDASYGRAIISKPTDGLMGEIRKDLSYRKFIHFFRRLTWCLAVKPCAGALVQAGKLPKHIMIPRELDVASAA